MTARDWVPMVSVIVPTLNDDLIGSVVSRIISEAEGVPSEVIVIGRDDRRRIPHDLPLRFIETERPVGASVARNIGISESKGRWLVFVDSDCLVSPGWLRSLLARLDAGELVVGGGVVTPTDDYWMLVYNLSMFHEFLAWNPAGPKPYLPTLNLAVARSVIDEVGRMDESLPRGQDIDWTVRMVLSGFRLYFEPDARVEHRPQKTGLREIWSTWIRSGYFNIRNRIKYAAYYKTPRFVGSPSLLVALSPLIGLYVIVRMFASRPKMLAYLHTAVPLYLTKIAWCIGAARALRNERTMMSGAND